MRDALRTWIQRRGWEGEVEGMLRAMAAAAVETAAGGEESGWYNAERVADAIHHLVTGGVGEGEAALAYASTTPSPTPPQPQPATAAAPAAMCTDQAGEAPSEQQSDGTAITS
jgi:hypothetical protein